MLKVLIMAANGILYNVHNSVSSCNGSTKCWTWNVPEIISLDAKTQVKYAVLILNRPIGQNAEFFRQYWNNATIRVTIDGGTVRWDRFLRKLPEEEQKSLKIPDLITGDFDSVTSEILEEYKKKGCKAVHTPDQDYTDFTKSLIELNIYCKDNNIEMDHVIAVGESSGRLDQILGNIQTLFLNKEKQILSPHTNLFILSEDALSWLLYPGYHEITIPDDSRTHKRAWCSLVPVGGACDRVTSTGLKWNLDNQPLRFGELVSTSNTFSGTDKVTIKCSHPLLWSMRIPSLMNHLI